METIVEIRNFELRYDGAYHITWYEGEKIHEWYLHLGLSQILRMVELEGLSIKEIYKAELEVKPLKFEKVIMQCTKQDSVFYAYGFLDGFEGSTLESDGFTVELSTVDSIENHRGEILLMSLDIKE